MKYIYTFLQAAQNLTLPKWTEKVFPSPMKDITALDFNLRSFTTTLRRLNGGKNLLNKCYFNNLISGANQIFEYTLIIFCF